MDNENNLSGCLAYTAVLIVGAIISTIIILVFNIRIPIVIPALVIAAIIGWMELRKRRRDMEVHLGREIKGDHELVSLSSWMEVSNERKSINQAPHPINNQRMQPTIVNTSTEIRNTANNPIISRAEKNQDEKLREKPIGRILSEDEVKQILMRVTTNPLLESGNPSEPRIYHYLFAHKYLPDKLSESSQGVIAWLTGEKGIEHLKTRWTLLPTVYNLEPKDYIEPVGINRYVLKPTSTHTIVLVQFPKPEQVSEAFFSAILIQPDNSYRYFTLEKTFGEEDNGTPKTVLGEWAKGNHVNLGSGSSPIIEDFSALIIERFI